MKDSKQEGVGFAYPVITGLGSNRAPGGRVGSLSVGWVRFYCNSGGTTVLLDQATNRITLGILQAVTVNEPSVHCRRTWPGHSLRELKLKDEYVLCTAP